MSNGSPPPDASVAEILSQLPSAAAVYEGPDHVFVAASDAYRRFLGGRDPVGRPFREVLPELDAQGFGGILDAVFTRGEPANGKAVLASWDDNGDGVPEEHFVDFVYSPLRDRAGKVWGIVAQITDVTEATRQERERELLSQASELLASSLDYEATLGSVTRLAVKTLADWCAIDEWTQDRSIRRVAVAHPDPRMLEVAYRFYERYPMDPEAPQGIPYVLRTGKAELVPRIPEEAFEAIPDPEQRSMARALDLGSYMCVPLVARGETIAALTFVRGRARPAFGPRDRWLAEELGRRAAVAMDNAQLYAAEHHARDEAERANQAKSEFLATMSHELRTPLNAMIGYADLLIAGVPDPIPEGPRQKVERIGLSARHLLTLIEEILTFSRLDAGEERAEIEPVDLGALVGELQALMEPLALQKGLRFECHCRTTSQHFPSDARKLRQILINLVGNAIKFTREGSVAVSVSQAADAVEFRVTDTGRGIPAEHHERIFEPFWQVDRGPTRGEGGTGLGLTVSRRFARLLGGDLTLESEPEAGSTFLLTLPAPSP